MVFFPHFPKDPLDLESWEESQVWHVGCDRVAEKADKEWTLSCLNRFGRGVSPRTTGSCS